MQRCAEGDTHLKRCGFMSIVWILELINGTPVNWIFLLRKEKKAQKEFEGKTETCKGDEKPTARSRRKMIMRH